MERRSQKEMVYKLENRIKSVKVSYIFEIVFFYE